MNNLKNKQPFNWTNKISENLNNFHKKKSIWMSSLKERFSALDRKELTSSIKNTVKKKINLRIPNPSIYLQKLQDKLEQTARSDTNQVVLKQSRFWASAITWVLMGSTAFAIGWISIAETDEIVIARGKLIPKRGVVDVQMPLEGVVEEILIKDGDYVSKEQLLIRLDTEATKVQNLSLKNNLKINKDVLNRLSVLVEQGAVSELQYMQQKEKIEDLESQLKINQVRLKYQEILAPVEGKVFDLKPKGEGYVARASEVLLKIVPEDNLIAKIEIDSRTIGFVRKGKKAEISIDSFPASDFGVIEGVLTSIGSDALEPKPSENKGYRFPAKVELYDQHLELKSGQKLSLKPGMSLTANIKLRKVTYLQLFLNKFTDKANSLKSL
ncbi:HlyD family secretion protein [Prochlorococcus marinus]|uniref:HlyD family secretion protein n=1 Tax=Prochlorococcus marinus TaxID=1219 RepID=UPI0022B4B601|nr:HlyD family efflux transporter periplasmic adaptor subunit [Prochlorococcus marinus]